MVELLSIFESLIFFFFAMAAFGLKLMLGIYLGMSLFFFILILFDPTMASILGLLLIFFAGVTGSFLPMIFGFFVSPIFFSIALAICIYIGPPPVEGLTFLTTFFFFLTGDEVFCIY
jgi:hypothetical protein